MTQVAPTHLQSADKMSKILVVDTDVHVHESPGELAPYCDMPWRVALENIKDYPETYLDIPSFSPGISDGSYQAKFPTAHITNRMVWTKEQMRTELNQIDVDLGLLFPDHLLKLPVLTQTDYAAAIARAYNRWLVDTWTSQKDGLLGCIVACTHDPEDAAREIAKYADHPDMVAIYLPCAGLDPLWGNPKYHPIFEAAQHYELPVLLHSATVTHPVFPFNNHGFDTELARHTTTHTFPIMVNLIDMITRGTFTRFPRLKVAASEAGISFMPFLMYRLDKEYTGRRKEVPFLKEKPSHYLKQVYVCTQPIEEPDDLHDLVKIVELYEGENTTMFASDWPHLDFDHPMKFAQAPFSDEVLRKVMGENALRFLNIDATGRRV